MIRFIFYTFVFYVVIKILRMFLDPFFEKRNVTPQTKVKNNVPPTPAKPIVGEYIEYEEIK